MTKRAARPPFRPDAEKLALLPDVSGNTLNGHGEREDRRPTPIYWHDAEILPHGKLMQWYQSRRRGGGNKAARERIGVLNQTPLAPVAETRATASPQDWTGQVKSQALSREVDTVGITRLRPEWVFESYEANFTWMIMLVVGMDYGMMRDAPSDDSSAEVMGQYERGTRASRSLAEWIRGQGYDALPHCGPRRAGFADTGGNRGRHRRARQARFHDPSGVRCLVPPGHGADRHAAGGGCARSLRRRQFLPQLPGLRPRMPGRRDPRHQAVGARHREVVRRFRQMRALFQRAPWLRDLPRGVPVEPPRYRPPAGGKNGAAGFGESAPKCWKSRRRRTISMKFRAESAHEQKKLAIGP